MTAIFERTTCREDGCGSVPRLWRPQGRDACSPRSSFTEAQISIYWGSAEDFARDLQQWWQKEVG